MCLISSPICTSDARVGYRRLYQRAPLSIQKGASHHGKVLLHFARVVSDRFDRLRFISIRIRLLPSFSALFGFSSASRWFFVSYAETFARWPYSKFRKTIDRMIDLYLKCLLTAQKSRSFISAHRKKII